MGRTGNELLQSETSGAIETLPALFGHTTRVYNAMLDSAAEGIGTEVVYRGHLTRVFQELGLSVPYYTSVMQALKQMGCVEQIRRGGGGGESEWSLFKPPTPDLFTAKMPTPRRRQTVADMAAQRAQDAHDRLNNLETFIGSFNARLTTIERWIEGQHA